MNTAEFDSEMQELLESFLAETHEILDNLDQDLMKLESQAENMDLMNSIFRSFHTIKGTSSFMGFDAITTITHQAEDLLNKLRRSELKVTSPIVDVLLEVFDWLTILLADIERNNDKPVDYSSTLAKIASCLALTPEPIQDRQEKTLMVAPILSRSAVDTILSNATFTNSSEEFTGNELDLIDQAFREINQAFKNEAADISKDMAPDQPLKTLDTSGQPVSREQHEPTLPARQQAAMTQHEHSGEDYQNSRQEPSMKNTSDPTVRVDVQRLESLMDLSGELVLGRNRLAQITETLLQHFEDNELVQELQRTGAQINLITTEIQSAIMKTRMVPIAKLFQKAPRIIRDLSREFGKEIDLELQGEETELDRTIIEELSDPLVHVIRNSCDHGIETPDQRIASGKAPRGKLILAAGHEGNHIVIRIMDDGKGMSLDKLKEKAIEKGVITRAQAQQLSSQEALNLIFTPGFSTAEKVSNISGRGVGMDVVRTNIQRLKGIIHIDSVPGQGTMLTIKLPLTLAIIQGLLVRVHDEIYALPLSTVLEVVSAESAQLSTINQQAVIRIREQVFPVVSMEKLLRTTPGQNTEDESMYVVIAGLAEHRLGLIVHEFLGQKEIVVKSLGDYLGDVPCIAGSTILGDGRVIMIVDVGEIIRRFHQDAMEADLLPS